MIRNGSVFTKEKYVQIFQKTVLILACLVMFFSTTGFAKESQVYFDIPSKQIGDALDEFVKQTDLSLLYSLQELGNVSSKTITGQYKPNQALSIMLEGTGLVFEQTGQESIAIRKDHHQAQVEPQSKADESKASPKKVAPISAASQVKNTDSATEPDEVSKPKAKKAEGEYQEDFLLEEMIVTASKRPRKLQDVPISIYALTGEQIERAGFTSIEDIGDMIGGFEIFDNGLGALQISSRGVTNLAGGWIESTAAVGYYLDEVPISSISNAMPGIAMWDMERIEVLRGPQGTLFGEGSMAGTIRVITNKPDTTKYSSGLAGDISSTEMGGMSYSMKGMFNAPLVEDKLALRVGASYSDQSGWIDVPDLNLEDTNEISELSTRIAGLWTPNDKLIVEGSFHYQDREVANSPYETTRGVYNPKELVPFIAPLNELDPIETDYAIGNLTLNYDLGVATLVSATSYYGYENYAVVDVTPYVPLYFGSLVSGGTSMSSEDTTIKLWTQELRLVSNGDERLDWTVGVFYKSNYREATGLFSFLLDDFMGIPGYTMEDAYKRYHESDATSYAVFVDVDYELYDKISIGGGVRYYVDDREFTETLLEPSIIFGQDPNLVGVPIAVSGDDRAITPKITLNWKPNDDVLVFAKMARGFRSGGTNLSAVQMSQFPINNDYSAESLLSYEAGVKTNIFGHLTVNAYIYYNDWVDLQLQFLTPDAYIFRDNAGSARSFGSELEVFAALPVDGWTVNLSTSYINAEIAENVVNSLDQVLAEKGNTIPFAPKWKFSIETDYYKPLSDKLFGVIHASYSYRTETYSDPENSENQKNDPYDQVSASIGVEGPSWSVQLYGKNLFDNDDTIMKINKFASITSLVYNNYVTPRTIGLRFTAKF
ncbi:MAG: TonB-dependent receptor [Deltaproteobacteria bacterium]|nr:TonB-dependent receptor [Deltaproteobacteria bacterium]